MKGTRPLSIRQAKSRPTSRIKPRPGSVLEADYKAAAFAAGKARRAYLRSLERGSSSSEDDETLDLLEPLADPIPKQSIALRATQSATLLGSPLESIHPSFRRIAWSLRTHVPVALSDPGGGVFKPRIIPVDRLTEFRKNSLFAAKPRKIVTIDPDMKRQKEASDEVKLFLVQCSENSVLKSEKTKNNKNDVKTSSDRRKAKELAIERTRLANLRNKVRSLDSPYKLRRKLKSLTSGQRLSVSERREALLQNEDKISLLSSWRNELETLVGIPLNEFEIEKPLMKAKDLYKKPSLGGPASRVEKKISNQDSYEKSSPASALVAPASSSSSSSSSSEKPLSLSPPPSPSSLTPAERFRLKIQKTKEMEERKMKEKLVRILEKKKKMLDLKIDLRSSTLFEMKRQYRIKNGLPVKQNLGSDKLGLNLAEDGDDEVYRKLSKQEKIEKRNEKLIEERKKMERRKLLKQQIEREKMKYPFMTPEEKLNVILNTKSLREDVLHNETVEASRLISKEMKKKLNDKFGNHLGDSIWSDPIGSSLSEPLDALTYTSGKPQYRVTSHAKDASIKILRNYKKYYRKKIDGIQLVQRIYRGYQGKRFFMNQKRERTDAAIRLQRLHRRRLHIGKEAIIIQTVWRSWYVRNKKLSEGIAAYVRRDKAARIAQNLVRRHLGRKHAVTLLQRWFRYRQRVYIFACAFSIQHKFRRWRAARYLRATRFARGYLARRRYYLFRLENCVKERTRRFSEESWIKQESESARLRFLNEMQTIPGRKRLNYEIEQQRKKRVSLWQRVNEIRSNQLEYQLEIVRILFEEFNFDGNDGMDAFEMESLLKQLGIECTSGQRSDFFKALDVDESGNVEFSEFKSLVGNGDGIAGGGIPPAIALIMKTLIKRGEIFLQQCDDSTLEIWSKKILQIESVREAYLPSIRRFRNCFPPRSFCQKCFAPFPTIYFLELHHIYNQCPGASLGKWSAPDEKRCIEEACATALTNIEEKLGTKWGNDEIVKLAEKEKEIRKERVEKLKEYRIGLQNEENVERIRDLKSKIVQIKQEEKRYEAEIAFRMHDQDAGGTIDVSEFKSLLSTLGIVLSYKEVKELTAVLDEDGSGEIDEIEFVGWYLHGENKSTINPMIKAQLLIAKAKLKVITAARNVTGANDKLRAVYHLKRNAIEKAKLDAVRKYREKFPPKFIATESGQAFESLEELEAFRKTQMLLKSKRQERENKAIELEEKKEEEEEERRREEEEKKKIFENRRERREKREAKKQDLADKKKNNDPIEVYVPPGPLHTTFISGPNGKTLTVNGFRPRSEGGSILRDKGVCEGMHLLFLGNMDVSNSPTMQVRQMVEAMKRQKKRLIFYAGLLSSTNEENTSERVLKWLNEQNKLKELQKKKRSENKKRNEQKYKTQVRQRLTATQKNTDERPGTNYSSAKKKKRAGSGKSRFHSVAKAVTLWHEPTDIEMEEMKRSRQFFEEFERKVQKGEFVDDSKIDLENEENKEDSNKSPEEKKKVVWNQVLEKEKGDLAEIKAVQVKSIFLQSNNWGKQQLIDEIRLVKANRKKLFRSKGKSNDYEKRKYDAETIFMQFDTDASGFVDINEFKNMISQLGVAMSPMEMHFTLDYIDRDKSGQVDIAEFAEWFATLNIDDDGKDVSDDDDGENDAINDKTFEMKKSYRQRAALIMAAKKARLFLHFNGRSDILRARYNLLRQSRPEARKLAIEEYRKEFPPPTEVLEEEAAVLFEEERKRKDAAKSAIEAGQATLSPNSKSSKMFSSASALAKVNQIAVEAENAHLMQKEKIAEAAHSLGIWSQQKETKVANEAWRRAIEASTQFLYHTVVGQRQLKNEIAKVKLERQTRFKLSKLQQRYLAASDLFLQFNPTCTGMITPSEFKSLLDFVGLNMSDRNFDRLWSELDVDGNGIIYLNNFTRFYCEEMEKFKKKFLPNQKKGFKKKYEGKLLQMKLARRDVLGVTDETRARYNLLADAATKAKQNAVELFRKKYPPPFAIKTPKWTLKNEEEAGSIASAKAGMECITFLQSTKWGQKTLKKAAREERRKREALPIRLEEEEKLIAATDCFQQFDLDCSGDVDRNELESMLRALGFEVSNIEFNNIMNDLDENGDGVIDLKEWQNWYVKYSPEQIFPGSELEDPRVVVRLEKMKRLRRKMYMIRQARLLSGELDTCRARYRLVTEARKEGRERGLLEYRQKCPPPAGTVSANALVQVDGPLSVEAATTANVSSSKNIFSSLGGKETWSKEREEKLANEGSEIAMKAASLYVEESVSGAAALSVFVEKLKGERKRREAISGVDKMREQRKWEGESLFMLFDEDVSGSIDRNEFGNLVAAIGMQLNNDELNSLLNDLDTDHSGDIDLGEFLTWYTKLESTYNKTGVSVLITKAKKRRLLDNSNGKMDALRGRYYLLRQAREKGRNDAIEAYRRRCKRKKENSNSNGDGSIGENNLSAKASDPLSMLTEVEKRERKKREEESIREKCRIAEQGAMYDFERFMKTSFGKKSLEEHSTQEKELRQERLSVKKEDEKVLEAESCFMQFDEDASGSVDAIELRKMLNALGLRPTPEELSSIIHEIDEDGSGEIEMDEFVKWFAKDEGKKSMKVQLLRAQMRLQYKKRVVTGVNDVCNARYKMLRKRRIEARQNAINEENEKAREEKQKELETGIDVTEEFVAKPDELDWRKLRNKK
eukprot:g416.t1